MKNSIWQLIDPNLNIFVSVTILNTVPSRPHCAQNYLIRCLSRDAHSFWDILYELIRNKRTDITRQSGQNILLIASRPRVLGSDGDEFLGRPFTGVIQSLGIPTWYIWSHTPDRNVEFERSWKTFGKSPDGFRDPKKVGMIVHLYDCSRKHPTFRITREAAGRSGTLDGGSDRI
jgi:hypothetical protein